MADRNKVLEGLMHHASDGADPCIGCPYCQEDKCSDVLAKDALEVLAAQEAAPGSAPGKKGFGLNLGLIDKEAMIRRAQEIIGNEAGFKAWAILKEIREAPTVEPSLVHCEECAFWRRKDELGEKRCVLRNDHSEAEGFCSYAVRK